MPCPSISTPMIITDCRVIFGMSEFLPANPPGRPGVPTAAPARHPSGQDDVVAFLRLVVAHTVRLIRDHAACVPEIH